MTRGPLVSTCRWIAVSALSALCLWRSLDAFCAHLNADGVHSYVASWRSAARNAPAGSIALLGDGADRIAPLDRSRLIAISWERAPDQLTLADDNAEVGAVDSVLSSVWHSRSVGRMLEAQGFTAASTNAHVKTWVRKGVGCSGQPQSPAEGVSQVRELLALVLEAALVFAPLFLLFGRHGFCWWSLVVSFSIAVGLGWIALSHPLLAPNGLGVYGGKAKLLYECGGIPESFLDSAGGMALQPSYPPGLTLLAYLHFLLSGGCGDRLVQLVVVFALAALCLALLRGASRPSCALPIVLFCVSPNAIRMASGFYAEPFVALLLVFGWRTMRNGRPFVGALVMGVAGLFRPEAGVAAALFAACGSAFRGNSKLALAVVVPALVPTVAWIATCRLLGYGGLADWNVMMMPRFGQVAYGALAVLDALWKQAIPVFALLFLVRSDGIKVCYRDVVSSIVPVALLFIAIPLVCGFYDAPYAKWMMDNTSPRLVWYLLAVPLFAAIGFPFAIRTRF